MSLEHAYFHCDECGDMIEYGQRNHDKCRDCRFGEVRKGL